MGKSAHHRILKEEFSAEMENFTVMKTWYNQLVLSLEQKIDRLNNKFEESNADMTAVTLEHKKCRNRVKTLEEEGGKAP